MKEVFLFDPMNNELNFSKDGKYLLIMGNDSVTHMVYDALTLEKLSHFKATAKDASGYDVTYFYGSQLSYDGSYIVAGDSYNRYIFKRDGEFVRSCPSKNIYTIFQYSKTEFCGVKNSDDTYTKTHIVAIDFLTDKETEIYKFESYVSTIHFNKDNTAFCYDVYPKVSFLLANFTLDSLRQSERR